MDKTAQGYLKWIEWEVRQIADGLHIEKKKQKKVKDTN